VKRINCGFTIIELVVVLAVLAALAGLLFPIAEHSVRRQKEADLKQALFDVRRAIDRFHATVKASNVNAASVSGFPPNLETLVNSNDPSGIPYLRYIPRDPFSTDEGKPPAATWLLRSYQSPPGASGNGVDVYDISSSSEEVGTNGIPYREW
jgi:general secretion pathway protein G